MRPDLTRVVDSYQDDIVRFAQKLIQTRSLPGQEQAVAALVQAELERLGYDQVWRDEVGNVIGLMKGPAGAKSVMLNSHMDHVDAGDERQWPYPPYSAVIANECIWGRAACDVKGALAVQVYAPALARKANLAIPSHIYLTAVVLEERGGWGTQHLAGQIKADYAVLGEASSNEVRTGHRGRLELLVRFTGRSVHASVPSRGANPHYALARFLTRLRDLRMLSDGAFGHSTVAPTMIASDQTSPNVTPGELRLTLDWRTVPSETPAQITAKLQKPLDDSLEPGVSAAIEIPQTQLRTYTGLTQSHRLFHPSYSLPGSHPFVVMACEALKGALERDIEVGRWDFATDGGHLMAVGIPAIGFGPGEEHLAHTIQDRVAIAQLREAAVGYLALIERLK
ncbi:MAG: M20/M25/M40 family metallo-hydrolase [Chloroflexi bacterium]|nr:M20/M25/M40 family metallo-hydrolase [Chloroflexota bacterium]